jgi:hypothetical protein
MLNGGLSSMSVGLPFSDGGRLRVPVTLDMIDPLNRIKSVAVMVWTGDKAEQTSAERKARPGDSQPKETGLNYSAGLARGDVSLPDLPNGKVYWLQPVFVSGAGSDSAAPIMHDDWKPELAVQRKPATLRLKSSGANSRQVSIVLKSTLHLNGEDDENSATVTHGADLLERASGDKLYLEYKRVKQEEVTRGSRQPGRLLELAEANLANLAVDMKLDSKGSPVNLSGKTTPGAAGLNETKLQNGIKADLYRKARAGTPLAQLGNVEEIANKLKEFVTPLNQALELTAVPLPNEDSIPPGRSWSASADRPLPVETPGGFSTGQAQLTYTYLGERQRRGKSEAVIDLDGVITGKDGSESIAGQLRGTASVDVATGIATEVKIKTVVDIEAVVGGKPVRVIANVAIEMKRTF